MYRSLNLNIEALIDKIAEIDDVTAYVQLRSQLAEGVASVSAMYQKRYRHYWRMNAARLSESFYSRYFALLSECIASDEVDVETVARDLSQIEIRGRQSLQFSFATKLAHMVNPHLPVYDSFVAAFYFYEGSLAGSLLEDRLRTHLAFYEFLRTEYARVLGCGLLGASIQRFRTRFPSADGICDERVIDWLVWSWVSLMRSGAQRRGECLYA
jgi:hypothetical protein